MTMLKRTYSVAMYANFNIMIKSKAVLSVEP